MPFAKSDFQAFYKHFYPTEDIVNWLSYNLQTAEDNEEKGRIAAHKSSSYINNREFCFTLVGDIFTRFRTFATLQDLHEGLIREGPEKIDVGAVYDMPVEKKKMTNISPVDRELIFDIDMTDYDHVRSCCKGKEICVYCWPWMTCAAKILAHILRHDFGFKYIMPVFSGRRGIHLWVCDRRARELSDVERASIVGYMSVFLSEDKSAIGGDIVRGNPIHPTMETVADQYLRQSFETIFLSNDISNKNSVLYHKAPANIVARALVASLKEGWKMKESERIPSPDSYTTGETDENMNHITSQWWTTTLSTLTNQKCLRALTAAQFILLYPRLDVHVSTRKDHLLKLPFCIHPGTGSLCCPLMWEGIDDFDPRADPPNIKSFLDNTASGGRSETVVINSTAGIAAKWKRPLSNMIEEMSGDPKERWDYVSNGTDLI
eukprot:Tbor_TRINITY_DN3892_c0_g2::TRINITY_DN3892_c0_g2_i1::g.5540::m.5540/K02684/PRI1; DNA primase small subunit